MDQGRVLEGLPPKQLKYFPIKGDRTLTNNFQSASTSLRGIVPIYIPITDPPPVALLATSVRVEVETYQIHAVYVNQLRLVLICGVFKQDYKTETIYGPVQLDVYRTKPSINTGYDAVFYYIASKNAVLFCLFGRHF